MTPELTQVMVERLLDGWEGALHTADTYLQIVQTVPDYRSKVDYWLSDPHRQETTRERFRPVRELLLAVAGGTVDDSHIQRVNEWMNPKQN